MATESNEFFLGKIFDSATGKTTDEILNYNPADMTTHAFVTGMTGSGKTGLCITMLEEAALKGIPAIIVDLKGDLTNLILHFPDLLPSDFKPWLDPESGRRVGKTIDVMADEAATNWKTGLNGWGLGKEQILALKNAVEFCIYTPGSSAGVPVNIVSSFQAPEIPWEPNAEILREKIASMVTALLGMVGLNNIDPLQSKEHILLSNLVENAWSKGQQIELAELIMQVQTPPIQKLGALAVDSFFPKKERSTLALLLNNFLASPSFQVWQEGPSLDMQKTLYTKDGKPRHSIFTISHLSENERMFFVTMLFANLESWMRSQRGTSGLRAILYFDEIMGYMPPIANPPCKTVLLRLLKQARAFGVGLLLATQNPVDIDYKGLSNTGTWIIGRLQTDQDKNRLLDGLQNASGSIDVKEIDKLVSGLQKRVFIMHNVNAKGPKLFQTRWCLNFLAGPLTRAQIPDLNVLAGVDVSALRNANPTPSASISVTSTSAGPVTPGGVTSTAAVQPVAQESASSSGYTSTKPAAPAGMDEFFLPKEKPLTGSQTADGFVYKAAILGQAEIRYIQRQYGLASSRRFTVLVQDVQSSLIRWEDNTFHEIDTKKLENQPMPSSRFDSIPGWILDSRRIKDMQNDFMDWVYRSGSINIRSNQNLKLFSAPDEDLDKFRQRCAEAAQEFLKKEYTDIISEYDKKIMTLKGKIELANKDVAQQQGKVSGRVAEEVSAGASLGLDILSGVLSGKPQNIVKDLLKSNPGKNISKRRITASAQADLDESKQRLQNLQDQLTALSNERQAAVDESGKKWNAAAAEITEIPLSPAKKDIFSELFGIIWLPFYLIKKGDNFTEIPAY